MEIERVSVFKILGLHKNDNLTWGDDVTSICCKSAKRLHFLKLLQQAELSPKHQFLYYESVTIRPVMQYACIAWHSSLTNEQTCQLESIQRRTVKLIFGNDIEQVQNAMNKLLSLAKRRDTMPFYDSLLQPSSILHPMLPSKRHYLPNYGISNITRILLYELNDSKTRLLIMHYHLQ